MHPSTRRAYEAGLRAAVWNKDMAPRALATMQREIEADRDRRLGYVALLVVVLAALALVTCSCARPAPAAPSAGENARSPLEQLRGAVIVRVTCEAAGGALRFTQAAGSGVVVSDHEVLTAYHVVNLGELPDGVSCSFDAVGLDGEEHPLAVVQQSELDDVVRLRTFLPFAGVSPVTIAPAPDPGEEVCVAAWLPAPGRRCGDVQVFDEPVPGARSGNLMWDGIVEAGNSGSGVYDQRGRLVAITTHNTRCPTSGQLCFGRGTRLAPLLSWVLGSP